ncbi:restriction endonuclease subunit S [Glaciecola sp. MF2-115]|uniref:restriction endonuclease subunit S n=1 Tax=Glaciecola sp. MF2-115 TaxID=3384827 RepID=UPI0039A2C23A
MDALAAMPKYDTYKNSGTDWLVEIPEQWEMKKVFYFFTAKKGGDAARLTKEYCGANEGDFPVYSGQTENDGVMGKINRYEFDYSANGCLFSTTVGAKAMTVKYLKSKFSLSQNCMIIVPRIASGINLKYFYYAFQPMFQFYRNQIPDHMQASFRMEDLYQYRTLFPSIDEQTAITNFLDKKTAQIDEAIAIKEKQITLLKERKQIIIQKAVTQGLDPEVPMKDSGVEWIGQVPEHWDVKRLKYVLEESSERSKTGEEPLFMVSQVHGLVVRADYHDKSEVAASNIDNKIVHKNDLVFNKLKAHLGVFFKSNIDFKGLVSPDYAVYRCKAHIVDAKLLELLFRHPSYIEQFIIRATGIVEGLIRLYTGDLFDISVPIAPENEQLEILAHIEKQSKTFDQVVGLQQRQIEKLKEYKTTLINSAVTGKIKVA